MIETINDLLKLQSHQDKVVHISCDEQPAAGREKQGTDVKVWLIKECPFGTRHLLDWVHLKLRLSFCFLRYIAFLSTTSRGSFFLSSHFLIVLTFIILSKVSWLWTLFWQRTSHLWGGWCLSRSLFLSWFSRSLFLRFSQTFQLFLKPPAVGHWTEQHLEHQTLESSILKRIPLLRSNVCLCVFPDINSCPVWPGDFCIGAGLADGRWLDIHTVMNGLKWDTWIHAALFSAM